MTARRWPWVLATLLIIAALSAPSVAEEQPAADTDATPPPTMILPPLHKDLHNADDSAQPFYVNPFPGMPQFYSTTLGVWNSGAHQIALTDNLFETPTNLPWGGPLASANFQTSVTYRYYGLFGGIVRPVARFTVGGSQIWNGFGRPSFNGASDSWAAYAAPEAGIEIVYKGVGVGLTASYPVILEPYDAEKKFTGGRMPGRFRQEHFDWSQLMKNIYLILE